MINLVHFADIHLGLTNYGRLDSITKLNTRTLDTLNSLKQIRKFIENNNIKYSLISGDFFKSINPSSLLRKIYREEFKKRIKLVEKEFIILGNHDISRSMIASSIDEYYDDDNNKVILLREFDSFSNDEINIISISPYTNSNEIKSFLNSFNLSPNKLNIIMAHLPLKESVLPNRSNYEDINNNENVISYKDLLVDNLDYVAMGDIHKFQVINNNPLIIYPGSISRNDFSEIDDKGFIYLSYDKELKYEFIKLECQKFYNFNGTPKEIISQISDIDPVNNIIKVIMDETGLDTKSIINYREEINDKLKGSEYYSLYSIDNSIRKQRDNTKNIGIEKSIMENIEEYFQNDEDKDKILKLVKKIIEDLSYKDTKINLKSKFDFSLLKIILHNFQIHEHLEIDFSNMNDAFVVTGKNGVGKTSIIEALLFVIYGISRGVNKRGDGIDTLVKDFNLFQDRECYVESYFDLNNSKYRIKRTRIKGNNILELEIDGVLQKGGLSEIKDMIESLISLNYECFLSSIVLEQGKFGFFSESDNTKKKEIVMKILGMEAYNEIFEHVNKTRREKDKEIESLEYTYNVLKSTEIDIDSIKNNIILMEDEYENIQEKLKDKIDADTINLLKRLLIISEDLKKQSLDLSEIRDTSEFKNKFLDLSEKDKELSDKMEVVKNNIIENKKEVESLKKKIINVRDNDTCPICENILSHDKKVILINDLKQRGDIHVKEYNKYKSDLDIIEKEIRSIKIDISLMNSQIRNIEIENARSESYKNTYNRKQKEKIEIESDLDVPMSDEDIVGILKSENIYNDLEKRSIFLERDIINNRNIIKKEEENNNKRTEIFYNLSSLKDYNKLLKKIEMAFSKKGVVSLILDKFCPVLEDRTNEYLEMLKSPFSFRIDTIKEKKNKTEEIFDFLIFDGITWRQYVTYSGGQKTKIDIGIHMAISSILLERSGFSIDFMFIDEGFGAIDEDGRDALIECIDTLKDHFKKIIVITHIENVITKFNKRINFEIVDGKSKMEIIES